MELTEHTMRCPLGQCAATVTVRTNPEGYPSHRHLDVTACSLRPPTTLVTETSTGYFPDLAPLVPFVREVDSTPHHVSEVACAKPCLAVLNAAEPGAAEPVQCTSGVSDGLELVRQTQSPTITRLLWFYSV
jgi:hypothetical protein